MNCNELGIKYCLQCLMNRKDDSNGCWIPQYENIIKNGNLIDIKNMFVICQIKRIDILEVFYEDVSIRESYWFLEAVKIFRPELLKDFEKLLVLL